MRSSDADRLARFVALARPTVRQVVELTRPAGDRPAARQPVDGRPVDGGRSAGGGRPAPAESAGRSGPRSVDRRREHADRIVRHWRTEVGPLTALPGFVGRFGGPVRDVLAATAQGVLVLSLAHLCQVDDTYTQVRLLAQLVLDEDLPAGWSPPPGTAVRAGPAEPAEHDGPGPDLTAPDLADLTHVGVELAGREQDGQVDAGLEHAGEEVGTDVAQVDGSGPQRAQWQRIVRRLPAGFARLAREMWAVRRLIDKRAEGRLWHRAVANLPAVGLVGATLGERHAASEIATRAYVALSLTTELPGI